MQYPYQLEILIPLSGQFLQLFVQGESITVAFNLATGAVLSSGIPLLTGHRGRWTEEETVLNRQSY